MQTRITFMGSTVAGLLLLVLAPLLRADIRLPGIVGDNMAIQRDVPARIWGWADPGEQVTVTIGATALPAVKSGQDGLWLVKLPAQKAGPVPDIRISGDKDSITIKNVIAGEVWLCSGQSNMEFATDSSINAKQEVASADYPGIRLFIFAHTVRDQPTDECGGRWLVCSPTTVGRFSAVGYFFGRDLHKELNVPVGLIESSWGGTLCEAWTSLPALQAVPEFAPIIERVNQYPDRYVQLRAKYEQDYQKWAATTQQASASTTKPAALRPPYAPPPPGKQPNLAAMLFNGMIYPIARYTIAGALWYQGESNAGRAYQYRKLLPTMIQDWRNHFGVGDFPFGIVQLANFMKRDLQPQESDWAELREAQTMTADTIPNCGLALAIDVGDAADIHPKNKQEVGHRLVLWALAKVYGKDIEYSGPVYDSMESAGDSIRIRFKHAAGGLTTTDDQPVKGFTIAGEDHQFVWADAAIDGQSVVVRSSQVPKPVAVRYAWANNPGCNLYNKSGLPAVPFRTDDWKGRTADAK